MMEKNLVGSAQLGLPGGLQGLLPGDERTHVRSSLREQKLGHRRVDEDGQVTYKKKPTSELMSAIQLGIGLSIGGLSPKPKRDVLYGDFDVVESIFFPREGSNSTPAHRYSDFRFKTYAPVAFRYFRDLFGIQPEDFLLSLCNEPLKELSNPGASGSIFYLSNDDEFIIKTVQHKEAEFLQKLLPGYYMNLNQNPRTLLPKFYGLYCYQCGGKNIRFIIMNNLLPSTIVMHSKFDLKGSTYKRKASSKEVTKSHPTYKDLDFLDFFPEGLMLEGDNYVGLLKTLERDCRVLQSFKIMDYSMLIGLHSLSGPDRDSQPSASHDDHDFSSTKYGMERNRLRSSRFRTAQFSTALEAIQANLDDPYIDFVNDSLGGIPVRTPKGEKLLLFIGIIDILQSYRFAKKLEHTFKSLITDGDTISVHRPGFYAQRFQKFFTTKVFKKIPGTLKTTPSRKKSHLERQKSVIGEGLEFIDASSSTGGSSQPDILPISSSPLPPYSTSRGDNLLRVKHGSLLNNKKSHIEVHEVQLRDITVHLSPKSQTMQGHSKSNAVKDSTVEFEEEDSVPEDSTDDHKQPGSTSGYASNDRSSADKEITTESRSSFPDSSTTVPGIIIYPSIDPLNSYFSLPGGVSNDLATEVPGMVIYPSIKLV